MNMWSKATIAALVTLGCAAATRAQQGPVNPLLPTTGTREVALRGNLFFRPNDTYNLQGKYGPFVTDRLQLAGTLGFDKSGGTKATVYGGEANYHSPGASATVPFAGVFLGGANIDGGSGGDTVHRATLGLQGGAKHFVNSSVAATAELQHRQPRGASRQSTTAIVFGLAVYQ